MSRTPFVSLATAVAALGLAAGPGCSTGASHAAGDAAQTAAAESVPWTASPVRAALIDWQAAVGERDVQLEVVGPIDVPVDPAASDEALSLAAGDTTAMVRRMTLRLDGERQEMEVDGPQFLPGNDVGPRIHGLDGPDGHDAWQYAAQRPYGHAVIDENGHRELVEEEASGCFVHLRIDSRLPRSRSSPLFSVNYFDREIRKDQACHVRETVQWSRDVNHSMDRMWLYGVWHNCFKAWRIRGPDDRTHAEYAGVAENVLEQGKRRFFARRYFFSHLSFSDSMWRTWVRGWLTPGKLIAPTVPAYVMA